MDEEIKDRHNTFIYSISNLCKSCSNSYNLWKCYVINTFLYRSGINLFNHTLWTILSTDENKDRMFQMTVID